ncbi:MAG TPA: fumarate hydratase [Oscillospiraceae bacterium]|nr:fumarate hydratase [Oscillospiraceae bacterium]
MREIDARAVTEAVGRLSIEACCVLPEDVRRAISAAAAAETWPGAREILGDIGENIALSARACVPLCQDTGLTTVFLELGQDAHITGGGLYDAVQEGVRRGYTEGYLRKSVVRDPISRVNTGDNTPATVYTDIVPGDAQRVTVCPKGAGSENMSRLGMLTPAMGLEGVKAFVLDTVRGAGGNPCPPTVVGVGLGGSFDSAPLLAKKALLRSLDAPHPDPFYAALEDELLTALNRSGIGPQGFGGRTTALRVLINAAPTHIAMLPVAVCISCHAARHASAVL